MRIHSPLTIEVMLACHCLADPRTEWGSRWDAPGVLDVRKYLFSRGMIDEETSTEKGRAWVEALCATPFPVAVWTIPKDEE